MNILQHIIIFSDDFSDLKDIGNKIIPSDIWSFIIQLGATAILVLILAKFLVKPARKFIEARKNYISSNLEEAETKNKEANEKLSFANEQIKNASKKSKDMIDDAKVTALNEKEKIVKDTQLEVASMKNKALKDIESERLKMKEDLSNEVIDVALLAASKVVNREISKEDNQKIVEDFIKDNK